MSLYAIGDLHLALGVPEKDMSVFGGRWEGYVGKIRESFGALKEEDVCVLCGDTSWGMSLEEALPDLRFLNELPGKKVLVKGNHDFWWETVAKMTAFFQSEGLDRFSILHNNCLLWEDAALCGTRGWFFEEETGGEHDGKIMRREVGRLETSLKAAEEREKLVFLHYPPGFLHYRCREILELLERYGVTECCSGHIHGKGCYAAFRAELNGTHHRLVSADSLDFVPIKIR